MNLFEKAKAKSIKENKSKPKIVKYKRVNWDKVDRETIFVDKVIKKK